MSFWVWTALAFSIFGVVYWKYQLGQVETQKSALMARQRAVAKELGPRITPFRERIERWVGALGGDYQGDRTAPAALLREVQAKPGVYLRLGLLDAQAPAKLHKTAQRSLLDGFSACFFAREGAPDPTVGPACHATRNCEAGKLCNEYDVCSDPPRPYNLRLAYRALKILSTEWTDELHETTSDLMVRALSEDLDRATHDDVPIAIEVLTRAKYVTIVVDEPSPELPPPVGDESEIQRLWRTDHDARVAVYDLNGGDEPVVRIRRRAQGRLIPSGPQRPDPANLAAQQRQATSCALALDAKAAFSVGQASAGVAPAPSDAPAPAGSTHAPAAPAPTVTPSSSAKP